jgi:L-alanine-DL-glutamate epimerase-like enolase superfamily enzyme
MARSRRTFLKLSALAGGALALPGSSALGSQQTKASTPRAAARRMKLSFRPYTLELKHVFTIAVSSRTTTPVVLAEIAYGGLVGYGEASMPPYLGETQETAAAFLSKVDLSRYPDPLQLETITADIDAIAPGNPAAKASIDIALHDVAGKLMNRPWYDIWGFDKSRAPFTSFTIGIDTPDVVRQKVREAAEYKILKVKLGRDNDKEMIETIRSVTDKPITVDANQGWTDRQKALDMIHWLNERHVLLVEQPMPKDVVDDMAWITERSPLPTIADEFCQRLPDVRRAYGVFSGINIKLMKCTGMREAHKMLLVARSLGMKVMLGCMTETSCAISAASHLAPMVDWADLDGALLIKNDAFAGTRIVGGKVTLSDRPGIGVTKIAPPKT